MSSAVHQLRQLEHCASWRVLDFLAVRILLLPSVLLLHCRSFTKVPLVWSIEVYISAYSSNPSVSVLELVYCRQDLALLRLSLVYLLHRACSISANVYPVSIPSFKYVFFWIYYSVNVSWQLCNAWVLLCRHNLFRVLHHWVVEHRVVAIHNLLSDLSFCISQYSVLVLLVLIAEQVAAFLYSRLVEERVYVCSCRRQANRLSLVIVGAQKCWLELALHIAVYVWRDRVRLHSLSQCL